MIATGSRPTGVAGSVSGPVVTRPLVTRGGGAVTRPMPFDTVAVPVLCVTSGEFRVDGGGELLTTQTLGQLLVHEPA